MKNFHPTGNCPVRDVISRLGDKWSMLVLITLNANGTMRFSDIHKTIEDISQRMLTVTLRTLESDGLIERKIYAEVPPRVEYYLTDTGGTLIPHIEGLVGWALEIWIRFWSIEKVTDRIMNKVVDTVLQSIHYFISFHFGGVVFNRLRTKKS